MRECVRYGWHFWHGAFIAVLFLGCNSTSDSDLPTSIPVTQSSILAGEYLPPGITIPPGTDLKGRLPLAYDPAIFGPLGVSPLSPRDSTWITDAQSVGEARVASLRNISEHARARNPHWAFSFPAPRFAEQDPGWQPPKIEVGPSVQASDGFQVWTFDHRHFKGILAMDDTGFDVELHFHPNATIFAPTHKPYLSCLEMGFAHYTRSNFVGTRDVEFVYDHCKPATKVSDRYVWWQSMNDADWRFHYERINFGEPVVIRQVNQKANGCWEVLLYDYISGNWNNHGLSCYGYHQANPSSWSGYETVNYMYDNNCEILPSIVSEEISFELPGGGGCWPGCIGDNSPGNFSYEVTGPPDLSVGYCFAEDIYNVQVEVAIDGWRAYTPGF